MAEDDEVKVDTKVASATSEEKISVARRRFLYQALTVTSGIALLELFPSSLLKAVTQVNCPNPAPPTLVPVREIASKGGRAAHEKGTAHEWTADEARNAGRKGGQVSRGGRGRLIIPPTDTASSSVTGADAAVSSERLTAGK